MAESLERFRRGLYAEHLDEAGFLFDLRRAKCADPTLRWTDTAQTEARLNAHVDALVDGGPLAWRVCADASGHDDSGAVYAAVAALCRARQREQFGTLLRQLDLDDMHRSEAVALALARALPREWEASVRPALRSGPVSLVATLADACALRGWRTSEFVGAMQRYPQAADRLLPPVGRLRMVECADVVVQMAEREELLPVASEVSMCLGDHRLMVRATLNAYQHGWAVQLLALGGGREAFDVLVQAAKNGRTAEQCVLALGVLGDLRGLRFLHSLLADPALAPASGRAMHWITGADLHEEFEQLEEIHEDELFAEERIAWRTNGERPLRIDGRPYGELHRRPSVDPDRWREWIAANVHGFDPTKRYRLGRLYSLSHLLSDLRSDVTDKMLREVMIKELAVRHGCALPLDSRMDVGEQFRALAHIEHWARTTQWRCGDGEWATAPAATL